MDEKVLGSFGQGLVAFDRGQGHLSFEKCSVIASRSFHCRAPLVRHPRMALVKHGYHLAHCQNFPSPLSEAGSVISQSRSSEVDHCFHLAQQSQTVSVVEVHEETFHYKSPHAMGNKIDLLVLMKDSKLFQLVIPRSLLRGITSSKCQFPQR